MVWFKGDDKLHSHTKSRMAGLPAMGLWLMAGSWCSDQLADGVVPGWYVDTWPAGRRHAAQLVRARLWHTPGHDCPQCPPIEEGWIFHDWGQANPFRVQVEAERAAAAERQRRARETAKRRRDEWRSNGVSHGVTDGVTHSEVTPDVTLESHRESRSPRPDPTRPDPKAGQDGGESHEPYAAADPPPPQTSTSPTRPRCARHADLPPDDPGPNCPACRDARIAAETAGQRRNADRTATIRRCRLCDADGRRLDTLGQAPQPERCDHQPRRPPASGNKGELERIRALAAEVDCDPKRGCSAKAGQLCVGADGKPLTRAPAHACRVRLAQSRDLAKESA